MLSAKFVGAAQCASCHEGEDARWRGSHHQLAMQPASDSTVLGDFNRASFDNNGITSTFFRRGSKFLVRTDGPDGALHDYEIEYTFGVHPLQQYLIAMPGGRLQAFGIAWDSRPCSARRATLVLAVSRSEDHTVGSAALDRHRSELELHVRRLSFDQFAQELRSSDSGPMPPPMPKSTSLARLATARVQITWRGRSSGGDWQRIRHQRRAWRSRLMNAQGWHGRSIPQPETRGAARRVSQSAKSRCARDAIRGAARSTRTMSTASRWATTIASRCSMKISISLTDRSRARTTNTARSFRAGCSTRA